jgi:hypothetical protein
MPIKYDELMALKNLGQKYAYTDRSPSSTKPPPRRGP